MHMIKRLARAVRGAIPVAIRRGLHRVGSFCAPEEFQHFDGYRFPSMEASLLCLRHRGFAPKRAVDVGAYHGEWTEMFKTLFPQCAVVMVEAQRGKEENLQKVCARFHGTVESHIALLGPVDGQSVSFAEMETGSSVFAERSHFNRTITTRATATLDQLIHPETRPVDMLKLDVQGYELEVLRGATLCLQCTAVVLMEVSFLPINEGCPLFAEVIRFMEDRGFRVVDFCSQTRRTDGVLWQSDLLFVRVDSGLLPTPALTAENWS